MVKLSLSNDAQISFVPPNFEDAANSVPQGKVVIVNIQLR